MWVPAERNASKRSSGDTLPVARFAASAAAFVTLLAVDVDTTSPSSRTWYVCPGSSGVARSLGTVATTRPLHPLGGGPDACLDTALASGFDLTTLSSWAAFGRPTHSYSGRTDRQIRLAVGGW